MVAYSFQKRFAPQIVAGTKRQTIRLPRKRHARPGETLQLFTGMRTRHCKKIIPDPFCTVVLPISIRLKARIIVEVEISTVSSRRWTRVDDLEQFARQDGFEDLADMCDFWARAHGNLERFDGVLICWYPDESAEMAA
jgi:hypothetical protein